MFGKASVRLALLVMATASATSHAQTVYNDGGTHTINGPSGPIALEGSGTTLDVVSPASIAGNHLSDAIHAGTGTTIDLLGGQVSSGEIYSTGSFYASGGAVTSEVLGLVLGGSAQISGGTFESGNGDAALLPLPGANIAISGGAFLGGSPGPGASSGGAAIQTGVTGNAPTNLTITGGTFSADGGGLGASSQECLLFSGSSPTTINISGGVYSGNIGISGNTEVSFFGSSFNYDASTGTLTGILEDGNTLNTVIAGPFPTEGYYGPVSYQSGPTGGAIITFGQLDAAPEPSSIVTLAIGLLGLVAAQA
jgi:hypothetical protein